LFQITGEFSVFRLALRLLKGPRLRVLLWYSGGGRWLHRKLSGDGLPLAVTAEDKERHNARARRICPWHWSRMIKEAAVNHGRITRRVRVVLVNAAKINRLHSSRRDSPLRLV
jgi:hypothetical protein